MSAQDANGAMLRRMQPGQAAAGTNVGGSMSGGMSGGAMPMGGVVDPISPPPIWPDPGTRPGDGSLPPGVGPPVRLTRSAEVLSEGSAGGLTPRAEGFRRRRGAY